MSAAACLVCGLIGAETLELASGRRIGPFCPGECAGLGWEAHFIRETGAGLFETKLIAWQWSRKRAETEGRAFLTPQPKADTEKRLDRWALSLGVA